MICLTCHPFGCIFNVPWMWTSGVGPLDHSFVPLDSLDVNNFRGCVSQLWYIYVCMYVCVYIYIYMIVYYAVTCFVGDSQWNLGLGATLWASRIKFPAGQGLWKMAWPIYSWFMIYRRTVIFIAMLVYSRVLQLRIGLTRVFSLSFSNSVFVVFNMNWVDSKKDCRKPCPWFKTRAVPFSSWNYTMVPSKHIWLGPRQ